MDIRQDWQNVISGYVQAAWEDALAAAKGELEGAVSGFLIENGTSDLQEQCARVLQASYDSLLRSRNAHTVTLVREAEGEVICQVDPPTPRTLIDMTIPPLSTRFRLVLMGGWKINGMFQPCLDCNADGKDAGAGQCRICGGRGRGYSPAFRSGISLVPFKWPLPNQIRCSECNGDGRCVHCLDETTPGWCAVGGLRGECLNQGGSWGSWGQTDSSQ